MADVFDFYVYDNRSIAHTSPEPIMQEDKDVAVWRFRIPKVLNNIDMSAWAWWFVYVNAKGQKFSELLTLNNDIDDPESFSTADYSIGYGISKTPGGFTFALEAINTSQGGEISGEWHTRTYTHTVTPTLQGNQAEYTETESDIISALIVEVQNKINSLVGGATPLVVSSVSAMTDTSKIYVLSTEGNWYYHNGTAWVSGGTYASGITIDPTLSQSGQAADAGAVGDEITGLKEDFEQLESATTKETTVPVIKPLDLTWMEGFVGLNGTVYTGGGLQYSNKIPVKEGDVVTIYRESDGEPTTGARFVTAYLNGTADPSKGLENTANPVTIGEGIDEIVVTIALAYGTATGSNATTTIGLLPIVSENDIDKIYTITANNVPNRAKYTFDLEANATYTASEQFEDMLGYRLCFYAKVSSLTGEIIIGKGKGQTYGGGIGVDGTNIYQYFSTTSSPIRTQEHGLTIKDYVGIIIDTDYEKKANVTLSTNGGTYTWSVPYWRSYYGAITVNSGNALTDCVLTYTCEGLKQNIWIFGDSYIEPSNTRWTYYLLATGHKNYLLNGFPGRNSQQAKAALQAALSLKYIPRKILWLLGMNDKDTTAPNAAWKDAVEYFIEQCEAYNIEPIFATIPNVPSTATLNTYKNAWVKASGYRYIDFANAVSADGSSTWYDGMLHADNVHPDVQGAIALYSCAVAEVPELLF